MPKFSLAEVADSDNLQVKSSESLKTETTFSVPLPSKPEPTTPDVVLAFVDAITRFTRSWRYYCFADAHRMAEAKIEAFGERCAFFVECQTQYEQQSFHNHEHPASRDDAIYYYDTPQPNRPGQGHFVQKKEIFPLRASRRFVDCPSCSGKGKVRCGACGGRGRIQNQTCTGCSGKGQVRCKRCNGEGSLITYTTHEFSFFHQTDAETLIPQEINDFKGRYKVSSHANKAFQRAKAHFVLNSLTPDEVSARLRIQNAEIVEATHRAEAHLNQLIETAKQRAGEVLFQVHRKKVTPVSYLNVRTGGRFGQFWAIGVRGHHSVALPPLPWDHVKLVTWLTAATAIVCTGVAIRMPQQTWANPLFVVSLGLTSLMAWQSVRRHRAVCPDRLLVVAGRESENKTRLFALIGSLLCYKERAGFGDACYEQLFELLRMDIGRTDLSASYRLTLRPSEEETDPVRLFMMSEGSLTSASSEVHRTLKAADTLLFVASGQSTEDDRFFTRILTELENSPTRPEIKLILPSERKPEQDFPQTHLYLQQHTNHFHSQYLPVNIALLRERFLEQQTQEGDVTTTFQMLSALKPPQEGASS